MKHPARTGGAGTGTRSVEAVSALPRTGQLPPGSGGGSLLGSPGTGQGTAGPRLGAPQLSPLPGRFI